MAVLTLALCGCHHAQPECCQPASGCTPPAVAVAKPEPAPAANGTNKLARRYTYTPRTYPVDERGFSPVDKALAKAYAREEMVADDEESSLNPYALKVISAYPLDGSYPYHCGWDPREYDIYNGVTQAQWFKGMVLAKAHPDGSLQLLLRVHLRGLPPGHETAQYPEGPRP